MHWDHVIRKISSRDRKTWRRINPFWTTVNESTRSRKIFMKYSLWYYLSDSFLVADIRMRYQCHCPVLVRRRIFTFVLLITLVTKHFTFRSNEGFGGKIVTNKIFNFRIIEVKLNSNRENVLSNLKTAFYE